MEPNTLFDYAQKLPELLKSPYGWLILGPFVISYVLNLHKHFGLPLRRKTLEERLETFNLLLRDDDLSPKLKEAIKEKKNQFVFKSFFKIKAKAKERDAMIDFVKTAPPDCDFDTLHIANRFVKLDEKQEHLIVKISKPAYVGAVFSLLIGCLIFLSGVASMLYFIPNADARLPLSIMAFKMFSGFGIFIASALASMSVLNPLREVVQARIIAKNLAPLPGLTTGHEGDKISELLPAEPNLIEQ